VKKVIATGILILAAYLIQTTFLKELRLASIVPNLLLFVTFVSGFMNGKKAGMLTGFFCGLLIDIFAGGVIGLNALVYMYIGYFNGCFQAMFFNEDIKLPLILLSVSELFYGLFTYITKFLLNNRLNMLDYILYPIIPELVYTVVAAVLLYRPVLKLYRRLEKGSVHVGD